MNGKEIFGLTGNMGCGKSTVGEFLRQYNDVVFFDTDNISKEILHDSQNLEQIKAILGEDIESEGKIDNKKVGKIIFSDQDKKRVFERFLHPKVLERLSEQISQSDNGTIFIVESAILYEAGVEDTVDKVILVTCDQEEQIRRIKQRNGWSDSQIEERLKSQFPNEFKELKSWVVINTNCSLEELKQKVELLYKHIKSNDRSRLIL